jgi:hypothetical protein
MLQSPDENDSQVPGRRNRGDRHRIRLIAAGISLAIIAIINALGVRLNAPTHPLPSHRS